MGIGGCGDDLIGVLIGFSSRKPGIDVA